MSEMQNEIACKALDLLVLLLARDDGSDAKEAGDGKRSERQTLVADVEDGVLSEMLAHVAFSRADAFSHAPVSCRERAIRVAGALVDGHPTNQYNMGEASLSSDPKQPVQGAKGVTFRSTRGGGLTREICTRAQRRNCICVTNNGSTPYDVNMVPAPADHLHRHLVRDRLEGLARILLTLTCSPATALRPHSC